VFGQAIEAAVAQEYDAIATIAGDAGVAPFIDAAAAQGIPVATFNSETATENKRLFFVGADLYLQGEAACEAMAEAIDGKGKVAIITGYFAVEAHELRRTGFVDKCAEMYPDIEIVGEVENTDKGDIAYTQAQDFMSANPDLAGIYVTAGGTGSICTGSRPGDPVVQLPDRGRCTGVRTPGNTCRYRHCREYRRLLAVNNK
jgi:ribose transport system substrate-binding protein